MVLLSRGFQYCQPASHEDASISHETKKAIFQAPNNKLKLHNVSISRLCLHSPIFPVFRFGIPEATCEKQLAGKHGDTHFILLLLKLQGKETHPCTADTEPGVSVWENNDICNPLLNANTFCVSVCWRLLPWVSGVHLHFGDIYKNFANTAYCCKHCVSSDMFLSWENPQHGCSVTAEPCSCCTSPTCSCCHLAQHILWVSTTAFCVQKFIYFYKFKIKLIQQSWGQTTGSTENKSNPCSCPEVCYKSMLSSQQRTQQSTHNFHDACSATKLVKNSPAPSDRTWPKLDPQLLSLPFSHHQHTRFFGPQQQTAAQLLLLPSQNGCQQHSVP